jgi:hypothetical protein
MNIDFKVLTYNMASVSTSATNQWIVIPESTVKRSILVLTGEQNDNIDISKLLSITTLSIQNPESTYSEAYLTMIASEDVLRRDWDLPEEDEAWANL